MNFDMEQMHYKNVRRGAAMLDEMVPGWEDKIDIPHLRMDAGESCICGQLFAEKIESVVTDGFSWAFDKFGKTWTIANGFIPYERDIEGSVITHRDWMKFTKERNARYEFLSLCWIDQIEKRRAEKGTM